jgi:hypothetical protein
MMTASSPNDVSEREEHKHQPKGIQMKKILLSAVLGTLFTLTINQLRADDPPYIANVYIGNAYDFAFRGPFYKTDGTGDNSWYHNYEITAVLDYPQPYVDDLDWWSINKNNSYYAGTGSVSWPSPSGDPLRGESWNGTQHILTLRAIMLDGDTPSNNTDVDNSYYFTYDGDTIYSYFCHGCTQGGGGVYIYNP